MNKEQLRKLIKEELKAVLSEFKSTTVFDLEVVMEVMGVRFKEQGDGGLVAVVRKVAEEAAEDARTESGAEAEELMRIAKLSRKCASLMSEAIVLLASATQEREALEESVLNEDGHTDVSSARRQAKLAIEDSQDILQHLQGFSAEQDLPSWWMKKVSLASAYLNSARDYLLTSGEPMNEMTDTERARACAASETLYVKAKRGELGEKFKPEQIAKVVEKALQKGKFYKCDWVEKKKPMKQNQP